MQHSLLKWLFFAVGYVFITSGLMKLVVPDFRGVFTGLGLPFPELALWLVAIVEIACGMLIAGRMYVRQAALPLIVIMIVAILMTKLPMLTRAGFLAFAFEARLDIVMIVLLVIIWRSVPGKSTIDR